MALTDPRRGEVWLVSLGAGRDGEPGKNRPAVIVSVDHLNSGIADELIVVVPLSGSRASSALRPEIPSGAGVDRPSRAICRGIRSISRRRLLRRVGMLAPDQLTEIERALSLILGLDGYAALRA
jgi:mRNA interferase MazF